jgi:hypothetical protein
MLSMFITDHRNYDVMLHPTSLPSMNMAWRNNLAKPQATYAHLCKHGTPTPACLLYIRPLELAPSQNHFENGNCNVSRNVGWHQTFDAALTPRYKWNKQFWKTESYWTISIYMLSMKSLLVVFESCIHTLVLWNGKSNFLGPTNSFTIGLYWHGFPF